MVFAATGWAAAPAPAKPAAYGQLPVYFEANRGQADARFQFIARGQEHGVYLAASEAVIAVAAPGVDAARFLRLRIVGANPTAEASSREKLPGTVNYFLGNDPAGWQTDVPTFAKVRFESVYPGIDLVYHSNERQLEYDFVLAPGADPRQIALRFEGADRLRLDASGELILEAGESRILQHKPVLYQTFDGQRRSVTGQYKLRDKRTVEFAVGRYDTNHPLVIDPVLSYSTFLGGRRADRGWGIAVDGSGAAFVTGETLSVFKSVPASGFQTNFAGGSGRGGDAFLAKLNAAGSGFEFLTYLGGRGLDGGVAIALDASGNPYVTGYTVSDDFPITPGVMQPTLAGRRIHRTPFRPSDAFVTKLNATGSALVYSTYLGGSSFDSASRIAVDAAGSAHVTGYTESTNFPVTAVEGSTNCGSALIQFVIVTNLAGEEVLIETNLPTFCPFQDINFGGSDVFIAKLNPDATALVYSTYFGGSDDENGTGIGVDAAGNAFVTGWTQSTDFPASTNTFQPFHGGSRDAFVTSFDPNGALRYSTFLGGSGRDIAFHVAVDAGGSAYVVGAKASSDFPGTPGAFNRGGVFRSTDAGGSWTSAGAGLTHTVVEALAFAADGALLAGTPRGVFRSADAGASWQVSFNTLSLNGVHALASDTATGALYAGTGRGLLISTNHGATWFFESGGLGARHVNTLAIASGTLLAGARGSGVLRSTNSAASWRAANSGLGNFNVNVLAVHPTDAAIIYAATDNGVYKSTNNGARWRSANRGLTRRRAQAFAIDPATPATLYAGTSRGIFKSTDGGSNWVASSAGLGSSNVLALAIDPSTPATVYAGTTNGLFKSLDAGATWMTNSSGLAPLNVKSLLIDHSNPATVYAGLRGSNSFGGSNDVFIAKVVPDGSTLAYSLGFGGRRNDQGWGIAVDGLGRAFVTGSTDSTNFPITNPGSLAATNAGKADAFLAQFDADGASMIFSAFLGGRRDDAGHAVAVDGSGAPYITGRTDSTNFPSASPVQPALAGRPDVFIAKVVPEVALRVARSAEEVTVSWPGPLPGFTLEGAESMSGPWSAIRQPVVSKSGWNSVALPANSPCRFFRLKAAAR